MFGIYRFILALNVVLFHILSVPKIGPLAVYSFFILSGYLMTLIMHRTYGYSVLGIKKYALNRFFRLYPVYWALLLITMLMIFIVGESYFSLFHEKIRLPISASEIISNITMIYPELRPGDYLIRLAPATWALTIELFFYVLIGFGISKNKRRTTIWFLLSLSYLIYNNIILNNIGFGYGSYLTASLPFSLGALIYFYKDSLSNFFKKRTKFSTPICTLFFSFNLVVCSTISYLNFDNGWKVSLICTALNLLFSSIMIIKLSDLSPKNNTYKVIDKFTGDLSYPIYVFHWAGACFASWLMYKVPEKNMLTFAVGLSLTILISIIVNKVVNDKIELIRNKIKSVRQKQPLGV